MSHPRIGHRMLAAALYDHQRDQWKNFDLAEREIRPFMLSGSRYAGVMLSLKSAQF